MSPPAQRIIVAGFSYVERRARRKKDRDVVRERGQAELRGEVLLEDGARDLPSLGLRVGAKHVNDRGGAGPGVEPDEEVEEVTSLLPLEERPELRAEEILSLESRNVGGTVPPPGRHGE